MNINRSTTEYLSNTLKWRYVIYVHIYIFRNKISHPNISLKKILHLSKALTNSNFVEQ